jgi:hypothetical protein
MMGIGLDRNREDNGWGRVATIGRFARRTLALGGISVAAALATATADANPAAAQAGPPASVVGHLKSLGVSPRLSELPPAHFAAKPHEIPLRHPPAVGPGPRAPSGAVQTSPGAALSVTSGPKLAGIGYNGSWPPDPNIAVGKTDTTGVGYIVQVANTEVAVFDKSTGAPLKETNLDYLWANTVCAVDDGDPIVQYDRVADRWLITQLGSLSGPFSECLAVSATRDPTGSYYLYQDAHFGDYLNDYPKFSVWPTANNSAYLATYNLFWLGISFQGAQLCAYDRKAMLTDAPSGVSIICGIVPTPSYLPAGVDGATPPADGTPGYFLDFNSTSSLRLYQLSQIDFSAGTATLSSTDISVPSFKEACGGGTCIPQLNTSQQLASLGDRLMYRLAYRVFSDHVSMVVDHSVAIGGKRNASVGLRWYELQAPTGNSGQFSLYQQGTFAPDSNDRWMGSMAMDSAGDIAVGYSKSSGSLYPEIDFTGRTPSMALGTLGSESVLQPGGGSQTGTDRWGDYTALRIDPDNDSTFWYTNEYYSPSSANSWSTFIGSFVITGSGSPPPSGGADFTLSLSRSDLTVTRGGSSTDTVTVTATSGSPSVSLSASSVPPKTRASFSPPSVTATDSSTLTITADSKGPTGTYAVTITGSDNSGGVSQQLMLTVQ